MFLSVLGTHSEFDPLLTVFLVGQHRIQLNVSIIGKSTSFDNRSGIIGSQCELYRRARCIHIPYTVPLRWLSVVDFPIEIETAQLDPGVDRPGTQGANGSNSECVPSSRQLRNITLRIYFWFNLCHLRNLRTKIVVTRFRRCAGGAK